VVKAPSRTGEMARREVREPQRREGALDENGAALPFQGISITDERLLEGKTLGPKVHRFGSETPWNDQFFQFFEIATPGTCRSSSKGHITSD